MKSYESVSWWWVCFTVTAVVDAKFYSASVARERLVTDLFVNYNSAIRPLPKGTTINITVNIELQHFQFQESDGTFNLIGLLMVSWHDRRLVWNPNDYNNLTKIPVSQNSLWVADLEVYNNAPNKFLRMHSSGVLLVSNTGRVLWSDTIEVNIFCTTNMHNWPHEQHVCSLILGSWTYDGFDLDITNEDHNASMNFGNTDVKNMEYKITSFHAEHASKIYPCCVEPYISIIYHFTFERYSTYVIMFRVLSLCVILLTLLALSMESCRGEKIWLNGVNFIIITFNLLYFAKNVGSFARGTPFVAIFYSCSLVIVTLAHCISVFALMATRSRFRGNLPPGVQHFLKSSFVQRIAPTQYTKVKQDQTELNSQFEDVKLEEFSNLISADSSPNEWTQLAKILERSALVVFGVVYLVIGTICFV